jgi:PAS domain S-box-containing protein
MKHREPHENERRLQQLNRRLEAIRNVNRLINHAKDSRTLLEGACRCLTETQGYFNAWIALMDSDRKLKACHESGLGKAFQPLVERLQSGRMTRVALKALQQKDVIYTPDPANACTDCPLSGSYHGRGAMTARIDHKDRVFGLLSVSIPKTFLDEEINLIYDLAEDLGHALFALEMEKDLRLHRQITKVLPHPMSIVDAEYRYQTVNEAYTGIYGKSTEEIVGRKVSDFYPAGFFENTIRPNLDRCLAGEKIIYETLIETQHAGPRWMEMCYTPYRGMDGRITGIVSSATDITTRKEEEQKSKVILQTTHDGFWIVSAEGRILEANDAAAEMLGYKKSELLKRHIEDIDAEERLDEVHSRIKEIKARSSERFDTRHRRKDGSIIHVDISTTFLPYEEGIFYAFIRDITDRKQAEKEMLLTLKAISEGVWKWNFKTDELMFSSTYYTMLGYEPGEFTADFENWIRLMHPEDREVAVQTAQAYLKSKPDFYENIFRIRTKQGQYRWIHAKGQVVERDESGEAVRMIGNHIDITELVQLDKKLKNIQIRNQSLLDHSPVCHKIVDLDSNLEYMSLNGFKMLKLDEHANVYGKPYPFAFFPEAFKTEMKKCISEVKRTGASATMEASARDAHGNTIWLDSSILPVFNDDGEMAYITVVSADTTERKKADQQRAALEKQLRHIQKIEAIGNLAGGIAHDFNNILFPIIGLSELLMEDLPLDSLEHENVFRILEAAERGSGLVQQILAFSRQTEHEMVPLRIQSILKEVLRLCRSTIPANIEIEQDIKADCGLVQGDGTQIHQIGMNLITNAYHAVQETGGKISVRLKEIELDSGDIPIATLKPGRYAVVTVEDTGNGIDPAHMEKIFDPYFTTKELGKGTGLGLAVAQGIIKEHGGDIKAYSELGQGSVFHVYLPLIEKPSRRMSAEKKGVSPTGHERILLVDDEKAIVQLERQVLEKLGYTVTAFERPKETLKAFEATPDDFDLVITDMAMPEMTGEQLANELMKIRPEIPVIICTGFSERVNVQEVEKLGIMGVLHKPMSKSEIAEMVRNVLDEKNDKNETT